MHYIGRAIYSISVIQTASPFQPYFFRRVAGDTFKFEKKFLFVIIDASIATSAKNIWQSIIIPIGYNRTRSGTYIYLRATGIEIDFCIIKIGVCICAYVFEEEKDKVKALLPAFRKVGLELIRFEPYMISLMRKNEYIVLYFFKEIEQPLGKRTRKNHYQWEFDAEPFENPEMFEFLGMSFPVPANPEHMLEVIYGKTWRTPIENYNAPKNTVVGRISYLAPYFKKLPFYHAIERFLKKLGSTQETE